MWFINLHIAVQSKHGDNCVECFVPGVFFFVRRHVRAARPQPPPPAGRQAEQASATSLAVEITSHCKATLFLAQPKNMHKNRFHFKIVLLLYSYSYNIVCDLWAAGREQRNLLLYYTNIYIYYYIDIYYYIYIILLFLHFEVIVFSCFYQWFLQKVCIIFVSNHWWGL